MKKGKTKTKKRKDHRQRKNIIKYMNRKIMDKQSLNGQYTYEAISKYMYIYMNIFQSFQIVKGMQIKTIIRYHCTHMKQKFKYMCLQ